MTDWKEQYLTALKARDEVEQANLDLYNYCTKLADERAGLFKQLAEKTEQTVPVPPPPPPLIGYGIPRFTSPPPVQDSVIVSQLRQDLSRAQQERGDLQNKLDVALRELETLKIRTKAENRKILQLTASANQLSTKVRDKEEELRGKAKLVEDVQDENVTLHLQLNVAEEKAERLQKENQDLVDRWMVRKGEEARKMNEEGNFA